MGDPIAEPLLLGFESSEPDGWVKYAPTTHEREMAELALNGGPIFWVEQGTGEPIVLVHGIPTDYRAWSAQMSPLAQGFHAIAYSRRHAYPNRRDGDLRDSTIENNALDLVQLIEKWGVAPVHLVGHSYGGFIAGFLAVEHPELLRSLVLVEPALASLLLRDPRSRSQALRLFLRHPSAALSASRYLRRFQRPASDALERGDLASAVRFTVDGVEDRVGAFRTLPDSARSMMLDNARTVKETELAYPGLTQENLGRIRIPTLVVNGVTSAFWLRAVGAMAARSIPSALRVVVDGAGHYPHLQQPASLNDLILRFLVRLRRPS